MPQEIDFGNPPGGYCLSAARAGETGTIQQLEFTSTEDGQHFVQRLEGIPNDILNRLSPLFRPSQVDSLLAICRQDGTATVYINELAQRARIRSRGAIEVGSAVTKNQIADIERLEFDVDIPADAGVVVIFSVGWRKGLFYDFCPIGGPEREDRQYDLSAILGQAYCHVMFQERFSISDDEWKALFAAKWFLFTGLSDESNNTIISHLRSGWDPDEKLADYVDEIKGQLDQWLDNWRDHSSYSPHLQILARAVERFQDDDYVSCTGLLFPRIEGILRTHHTSQGVSNRPLPKNLTDTAVASKIDNDKCLLMPHRFATYLREIYFANFSPTTQDIDVSRHSVAHGVADPGQFNQKSALLGLLIVQQLFYFLENETSDCDTSAAEQPVENEA
ncbi:MAG: hypothetical protein KF688_12460 [Pirellulales bacterium]|nr:hypothetical protein [Pirellulales bacterium]